ncbi:RNA-directed DNA polymerase [Thalassospira sp. CH_XMU1458]|uniref:RNA-directed DNA polymerase n=1 Tax=Thalassospira sp. CH_XMU1458 TaxID=3107776 RepID=UPI00300C07DA
MQSKYDLFETGQALGFPVNFKLVLQHLQQDMRDDWYADTLGYIDLFKDPTHCMDVILECLNIGGGLYTGDKRSVRSIPKKNFAERYSLETDFFDRFVYQAICTFLVPHFDSCLSPRVLSYRYNRREPETKYLFCNKINKWLDFEGFTYTFVRRKKYLVATDISNFFENISRDQLIEALLSILHKSTTDGYIKGQVRSAIQSLQNLLSNWTYSGDFGLPQNRDASSFLSNVLLSHVDHGMQDLGYNYYRYVDDIRIISDNELEARKALQKLITLLRDIGMNINATKTNILAHDADHNQIVEFFPSRNSLVSSVENMWRSKSRRVFIRSIEYIILIIENSLEHGETQSRSFRFAVNRLSQIIAANMFDVKSSTASQLIDYAISSLKTDAVSTDQLCSLIQVLSPDKSSLDKISDILVDRSTAIHDWQNYWLWILLASHKFQRDDLDELAKNLVISTKYCGEISGVLIWLHATGSKEIIEQLLDAYDDSWPYQTQRYFLMTASILSPTHKRKLHGKVPIKLLRTIEKSIKYFRSDGVAISEPERPTLSDLYADIKDYS